MTTMIPAFKTVEVDQRAHFLSEQDLEYLCIHLHVPETKTQRSG